MQLAQFEKSNSYISIYTTTVSLECKKLSPCITFSDNNDASPLSPEGVPLSCPICMDSANRVSCFVFDKDRPQNRFGVNLGEE